MMRYLKADYESKKKVFAYIKKNKGLVYLFILGFTLTYWIRRAISLGIWNGF